MHLLVTGANGLVGRRLVYALLGQGHRVLALGRGPQRFEAPARGGGQAPALRKAGLAGPAPAESDASEFAYAAVDLGDAAAVRRVIEEARPDVIINPAGMTDVDGCERDVEGAYVANVEAVATLCRAARAIGAHLLHVSTDYVFDGDAGPYDIDAIPNPRGTYAITKHLGEQTVRALAAPGQWAIARTAVVYGWPNAGKNNFGSWLVDTLRQGKPIKLFEDQWVSPSLALSVAEMLAELGTRKLTGLWHAAGAEVIDRVAFGRRLCDVFGFDAKLIAPSRMADVKLLSPRPAKSGLIVSSTAAALSARPLSIEASLARFHSEYKGAP